MSRISFVIPVRNDASGLRRCLESIRANDFPQEQLEIVVADNGSADGSADVARSAGAKVIDLPGLPVAALRNLAARKTTSPIIAFVDADHELASGWIGNALRLFADSEIAAAGAPYTIPATANWVQRAYNTLRDHRPGRRNTRWLGSGNLAIRRDRFQEVNGFDESLVTCEDVDLCARLRAKGYRLISDSDLASIHHGDPADLWEVLKSELWRGQDNLRVSLRHRPSLADLPGIVFPSVSLASIVLIIGGGVATPFLGARWFLVGLVGLATASTLRALRMATNGRSVDDVPFGRLFVVAATYEIARALALGVRIPHRRANPDEAS